MTRLLALGRRGRWSTSGLLTTLFVVRAAQLGQLQRWEGWEWSFAPHSRRSVSAFRFRLSSGFQAL